MTGLRRLAAALLIACSFCQAAPPQESADSARRKMVHEQIRSRGIDDRRLLQAMERVPRHRFVPESLAHLAYRDRPLPIGFDQTISQPYVVAWMTREIQVEPGRKVLEIGTGSGYQAAILAELGAKVYTIEIVPELARRAARLLEELGYSSIRTRQGDGYNGWPEEAPFDAIIVTAAPETVPQPLIEQLKEGGRLIVPVGRQGRLQELRLYEKTSGKLEVKNLGAVRFVPFTREK